MRKIRKQGKIRKQDILDLFVRPAPVDAGDNDTVFVRFEPREWTFVAGMLSGMGILYLGMYFLSARLWLFSALAFAAGIFVWVQAARCEFGRVSVPLRRAEEADGIADALAAGIASGHFFAAAHPDRAFRHRPVWTKEEDRLSRIILKAAREAQFPVEDNLSCHRSGQFRPEFWHLAGEYGVRTVCGLDAHSPEEVIRWTGTEYSERKKETI